LRKVLRSTTLRSLRSTSGTSGTFLVVDLPSTTLRSLRSLRAPFGHYVHFGHFGHSTSGICGVQPLGKSLHSFHFRHFVTVFCWFFCRVQPFGHYVPLRACQQDAVFPSGMAGRSRRGWHGPVVRCLGTCCIISPTGVAPRSNLSPSDRTSQR
jgi:hypothetical protein